MDVLQWGNNTGAGRFGLSKKSFPAFLPSAAFSWTVFVSLTGCGRAYHIKEENV